MENAAETSPLSASISVTGATPLRRLSSRDGRGLMGGE